MRLRYHIRKRKFERNGVGMRSGYHIRIVQSDESGYLRTKADATPIGRNARTGTCPALFERVQNGKGLLLLAAFVSLVASRWFWLPRCVAGRSLLAPVTRSLHALTTCGAPLGGLTNHAIENGFVLFDAEHLPTVGFLEVRAASRTDCHFSEFFILGGLFECQ